MRRWGQMGLVGDAAAGVVANCARLKPSPQGRREVARRAVIAGDDDRRPVVLVVEQRRNEIRPQRLRDERAAAVALQRGGLRIVIGVA